MAETFSFDGVNQHCRVSGKAQIDDVLPGCLKCNETLHVENAIENTA